jgi:hypothetical protein
MKLIGKALLIVVVVFAFSCAKQDHWGQRFKEDGKWWQQEGQSWDVKNKIFMTIGYSNPDWKDEFDLRRSSDTDARAQIAAFMQSLVDNYISETRANNFAVSESVVKSSAKESVIGAVIVSRHYEKRKKRYYSLIKVDLKYFFNNIYDSYAKSMELDIRRKERKLTKDELDTKIKEEVADALLKLESLEDPVVRKTIEDEATQ